MKKAKNAKVEKSKKLPKLVKNAMKVAAKLVGTKAKKPAPAVAPKKPVLAVSKAQPAKPGKVAARPAAKVPAKPAAKGKAAPLPKAKPEIEAKKKIVAPAKVAPTKAPPTAKKSGKPDKDVVLEVPAPKGVALLGREGKKKARAEASASSKKRCREPGCDHDISLHGFCRLHYIKNWRKLKRKEAILASGQLNNYVEELVSKYPDRYLDVIRQDLASEREWGKVVVDLELDSSEDEAAGDEDMEGVAEGVRSSGGRGEFDDDSETF